MFHGKKVKVVGFYGQSGAGKTTIIRNVPDEINEVAVTKNTGILKYLYGKNNYYVHPNDCVDSYYQETKNSPDANKTDIANSIIEKYIRSSFQLLNDFSTEIYMLNKEFTDTSAGVILVDSSPIDYYAMLMCGVRMLKDEFGVNELSYDMNHLIELAKKTALTTTENFFDYVVITRPWQERGAKVMNTRIRDQYMGDYFIGRNWYEKIEDFEFKSTKTVTLRESEILTKRIVELNENVTKICEETKTV